MQENIVVGLGILEKMSALQYDVIVHVFLYNVYYNHTFTTSELYICT